MGSESYSPASRQDLTSILQFNAGTDFYSVKSVDDQVFIQLRHGDTGMNAVLLKDEFVAPPCCLCSAYAIEFQRRGLLHEHRVYVKENISLTHRTRKVRTRANRR